MGRARLLALLIAAFVVATSSVSRAEAACRADSDIADFYHHMLSRVVVPGLADAAPAKFRWRNDWIPATAADVCNFTERGQQSLGLVADAPAASGGEMQEGRAVEDIR